jgi:hypothetical protein
VCILEINVTNKITKVYIHYNERLLSTPQAEVSKEAKDHPAVTVNVNTNANAGLHGRKLSPRTLRSHFHINSQYLEEAKNFVFNKDSMSFTPVILPPINTVNALTNTNQSQQPPPPMTFAEMAVLPLNTHVAGEKATSNNVSSTNQNPGKSKILAAANQPGVFPRTSSRNTGGVTRPSNSPPDLEPWEEVN